jgi:hypothetical protein
MFDRLVSRAHGLGVLVEPPLDGFENSIVLSARDAAFLARGALSFHGAVCADDKRKSVAGFLKVHFGAGSRSFKF